MWCQLRFNTISFLIYYFYIKSSFHLNSYYCAILISIKLVIYCLIKIFSNKIGYF